MHHGGWEFFKFQKNAIDGRLSGSGSFNAWDLVSEAPVGSAEFYPGLKQEAFWPAKKLAILMESRAQTPMVVQTSATVIETKPHLNLCIDKTNISTFISYSWGRQEAEDQRGQCKGGSLCVEIN